VEIQTVSQESIRDRRILIEANIAVTKETASRLVHAGEQELLALQQACSHPDEKIFNKNILGTNSNLISCSDCGRMRWRRD